MELGNKTAENNLLGCIIFDNSIMDEVVAIIKPDDFFSIANRIIYSVMSRLYKEQKKIDLVTLTDALRITNKLDDIGGVGVLMNLSVPTAANFKGYLDIVKREATKKEVMVAVRQINQWAKECENINELLSKSQALFNEIDQNSQVTQAVPVSEIATEVIEEFFEGKETGLQTGFTLMDKMLSGFHESELIILAARPAMGKTALALNIAANTSKHVPTLVFSLEMSKNELMKRLISLEVGLTTDSLKKISTLPEHLQQRLWDAARTISERKLIISDTAEQSLSAIKAITRQVKHKYQGLGLVVIDYLTLIKPSNSKGNRQEEVAEISRGLKMLAKEFRVPVLALAQVGRSAESRTDKRPSLSDLRESGAIEQDADVVMFLYRDEYYNEASEKKNQADVIVAKHRNGEIGEFPLYFDAKLTMFSNLEVWRK